MSEVINGNFTRDDWFNDTSGQLYLDSPSVDPRNTYFAGLDNVGTSNFSGSYVSVRLLPLLKLLTETNYCICVSVVSQVRAD